MESRKPPETVWRPVRDLPLHAQDWGSAHYRERAAGGMTSALTLAVTLFQSP